MCYKSLLLPILVSSWAMSGIIRVVAEVGCNPEIPDPPHGSCMVITAGMSWCIYSDSPSGVLVWVINYLLPKKQCFLSLFLLSWVLQQTKSFKSKDLVCKQYILYYPCNVFLFYTAKYIFYTQKNHLESKCWCIFTWKSTWVIPCLHIGWFPQQHYSSELWAPCSSGVWLPDEIVQKKSSTAQFNITEQLNKQVVSENG